MKKWKVVLYIIGGILLAIPLVLVLILASPVLLVIYFRKKKTKKQKRIVQGNQIRHSGAKHFSTPYTIPKDPLPDNVFIERIEKFTCLQFWEKNDHTGIAVLRELIASAHPEKKVRVLAFLQSHPIAELLQAERCMDAQDVNRWEIRFIFDDTDLNRSISGYGWTEQTAPYLGEMIFYLPEILTSEEQDENNLRETILEMEMRKFVNKEQESSDC